MKVLYVCAELFPFVKTGGLADVSAGLAPALQALGCDVRLLMPAFPALVSQVSASRTIATLPDEPLPWGKAPVLPAADVVLATLPGLAMPLYLLQAPALYERPGNPYLGPDGKDWPDNAQHWAGPVPCWARASTRTGCPM